MIWMAVLTGLAAILGLVFSIGSIHLGMVVGCSTGLLGLGLLAFAAVRRYRRRLWLAFLWLTILSPLGVLEIGVLDGALNRNAHDGRQAAFWMAIAGLGLLGLFLAFGFLALVRWSATREPARTAAPTTRPASGVTDEGAAGSGNPAGTAWHHPGDGTGWVTVRHDFRSQPREPGTDDYPR